MSNDIRLSIRLQQHRGSFLHADTADLGRIGRTGFPSGSLSRARNTSSLPMRLRLAKCVSVITPFKNRNIEKPAAPA